MTVTVPHAPLTLVDEYGDTGIVQCPDLELLNLSRAIADGNVAARVELGAAIGRWLSSSTPHYVEKE